MDTEAAKMDKILRHQRAGGLDVFPQLSGYLGTERGAKSWLVGVVGKAYHDGRFRLGSARFSSALAMIMIISASDVNLPLATVSLLRPFPNAGNSVTPYSAPPYSGGGVARSLAGST